VYPLLVSILPYLASTLVVLDVSSCQLSSLPAELALCTALEELNVANNPLGALPPWLGDLTSMRVLVIDGCGLHTLPAELVAVRGLHTICGGCRALLNTLCYADIP
jgi:Leucine-rich repeat (LRR) protein